MHVIFEICQDLSKEDLPTQTPTFEIVYISIEIVCKSSKTSQSSFTTTWNIIFQAIKEKQ